ncbi:type II toxin-antitoxin system RelE/ParE family toxin [Holosporaceae bacterium 'Namur']|nr:type II toxin-antitoxin system RelE/ParE family toxin [Holosporaceae bacterium 'Namur']
MNKAATEKVIEIYNTNGKEPINRWLDSLKDITARVKVLRRIDRLVQGNYGDHRYLSGGLFELKVDYGKGYRIYCGEKGNKVVVLLWGGDKSNQRQDIEIAKEYYENYLRRSTNE